MRRTILLAALFGAATTPPLTAQEWSSEEQQVIDQLKECWDIWLDGIRTGSPEGWISQCSTPTSTYWGAADGAPNNNDTVRRTWDTISQQDLGWLDLRPVSLTLHGDVAVLHFYGYWRAPDGDGEMVTEAKRTEVFRRIDGRWKMIAGHQTPVSLADAEPYRRTSG